MSNETAVHKKWREDNREKCRLYSLRWSRANKDKVKAYVKCHPEQRTKTYRAARTRWRAAIISAKAKPCVDCGQEYPWFCMDFDHIRGKKEFTIGSTAARLQPMAKLLEEIAKCDVVCVMCHRWRTHAGADIEH